MRALVALALLALAAPSASALVLPDPDWYCIPEDVLCGVPNPPEPSCIPESPVCSLEPPGFYCIPESIVCSPLQVACPRLGGTFGWCVRPTLADADGDGVPDGLNVTLVAGDWFGPRVSAEAGTTWASSPDAGASVGADVCRLHFVRPLPQPVALPETPCALGAGVTGGL